ncbi:MULTISPECIES: potassium-transporting ATPase subunit C [unclassified Streptomyces]|uniref:potassium-transporting ATPase subunit C n=1 Tax=unclassified Streptomyces TaxID=2593676 RepID=UPI002252229C|nr:MULTISPECIES: potassium-transporting ATPase subunit C [unclassified Streptomyces]WSU20613.1 potassium-transporting ATPase subunit C [Streptomyces sp. NBC_01108]MCX4790595.1 potassium-transporting ATPase subunit C [Streptomyces sp. NBC_01221]MCX4793678.1 potassium-transporting ATPase subunit C [Streptomyces sp. NBC_01242]WSJ35103.1 potassium-transporting ATPase subunit C [Streptomyces sp. NBC_01321]WSP61542.1 potassium-transporting ATPase subunit C [Streptomyces sp. NBC_01240]
MSRLTAWLPQLSTAARVLLLLILLTGLVYPLGMTALAHLPGLRNSAQGSPLTGADARQAGSSLIGQAFTDSQGNALPGYFQSRPSHAGSGDGYDPTASGASNLGARSIVDTLATGADPKSFKPSLLTQVCARSKAAGELEHVDGSRPYCTSDGVGAVLGVYYDGGPSGTVTKVVSLNQACPAKPFLASYQGVPVVCATPGEDYSAAVAVPVRGNAPAHPAVPADAVTASGSGLDPQISPAYAQLQIPRVARERHTSEDAVRQLVDHYTTGRPLGILGEPGVNVLQLNLALDRTYPKQGA